MCIRTKPSDLMSKPKSILQCIRLTYPSTIHPLWIICIFKHSQDVSERAQMGTIKAIDRLTLPNLTVNEILGQFSHIFYHSTPSYFVFREVLLARSHQKHDPLRTNPARFDLSTHKPDRRVLAKAPSITIHKRSFSRFSFFLSIDLFSS